MDKEKFNALLRLMDIGDEAALVEFWQAYEKQIKWVAFSILKDWHYSSDIVNEVMIVLWNKSKRFLNIKNPNACIYDLAKKASISFYRKYLKKFKPEIASANPSKIQEEIGFIHNDEHSNLFFKDLISHLSEIEIEIIIRKVQFNFTYAQIARDLKMPISTVKWAFEKALRQIYETLIKSEENSENHQPKP